MKPFLSLLFLICLTTLLWAQKEIVSSTQIQVTGAVKQPLTITVDQLLRLEAKEIADLTILNHKGEVKSTITGLQGVLLRDALATAELDAESPKYYSEFVLVCEATDGYKVTFSWNELFNNPLGDQIYILTRRDGQDIHSMDGRLVLLSPTDRLTGRRYLKGLSVIKVVRM